METGASTPSSGRASSRPEDQRTVRASRASGIMAMSEAMAALTNVFGDKKLAPLAVGKRLSF